MNTSQQTFVIAGAGLAGAKAAETLRERGFDGRVLLIGDEPTRPYERPPLSKGHLTGEFDPASVFVHDETFYAEHSIELLTATTVTGLDLAAHTVTLSNDTTLRFDKALLATGAQPRPLTVPGANLPGVHYLRTLADADALATAAASASSVAVVGAGWIGAEVAASLRTRGLPVALIEPATVPLERVLGREVGEIYRKLHAHHGVDLHLGEGVAALHGDRRVEELCTTTGTRIGADLVVVGVGAIPRTQVAAEAGLKVDDGVVTDEYLRTSHPDVYAAGDIANAWHPVFGARMRVEHWANASNQGAVAAANMLGAEQPYTHTPYFFSDQYDFGMEYTGYCPQWDQVVFRGNPDAGEFLAFWLHDGVIAAAMNANIWDVNEHLQQLVASRAHIPVERLTDPDVSVESLLPVMR
ncbi:NAD(P)/FAD-dependent oxidoreductase [Couchioplanes caeruleus]|uniref:Pyridine nucleotide-disulfide oxidoreductase n=2 Tax=Couchioplanes caeruleus TaxID=56438 RepID=A0A1K0GKH6_9ACTN|nr:FAD-dependent oxidoreductase [Couchioplanes caeruleus]OJF09691.1 pyridine nucleotide-disulfide oxidoreductase [Couchioplanes caeruleus subsp. caeruleus]ROP30479.1 3-phenylpropionate/trans-cinnamate dioxygenase ferredoxin reductase subunit [Couchioplanes caeruleus]